MLEICIFRIKISLNLIESISDNGFLIDSETCEDHGLEIPSNVNDCEEKATLVGIKDDNVLAIPDGNKACGCLAFLFRGQKHLHYNSPSGACSKTKKCSSTNECICSGKSMSQTYISSDIKIRKKQNNKSKNFTSYEYSFRRSHLRQVQNIKRDIGWASSNLMEQTY